VDSTGATLFSAAVGSGTALTSLTTNAGGTVSVKNVTTSGDQIYGDAVILGADAILTGDNPSFGSTISGGNFDLTFNFSSSTLPTIVNGGDVTGVKNLTIGNSGLTRLTGNISTSGAQTYHDNVELIGATVLASGSNAVTFNGTVNGASTLEVNTSGTITIGGAVGGGTALASLTTDAGGTTAINGGAVTTTGAQTYNDAVTLGAATTIAGVGNTFGGTVNGPGALTVNDSGTTTFGGAVGGSVALASITTDAPGTTQFNGGALTVAAGVTLNDAVTLGTATTLTTPTALQVASVSSSNQPITLVSDSIAIGGAVNAGGGIVTLKQFTAGKGISLGVGGVAGTLSLPDATTDKVVASIVRVGGADTGDITVDGAVTLPGSTLSLISGAGGIAQAGAGSLAVSNLRLSSLLDADLSTNGNAVSNLAGSARNLSFRSTGALATAYVDGVNGVSATGNVSLLTRGTLIDDAPIVAGNLLDAALTAGSVILDNQGFTNGGSNAVQFLKLSAPGSLLYTQPGGYTVISAAGTGMDFRSNSTLNLDALLVNPVTQLSIDAGGGNVTLTTGGDITIKGPGFVRAANITLVSASDVTLAGGDPINPNYNPAGSNNLEIKASSDLSITANNLTVKGGQTIAGSGQVLHNDAVISAGDQLTIATRGDFVLQGGTATAAPGASAPTAEASAFLTAKTLDLKVGGDFKIEGGTANAGTSSNGEFNASAIVLIAGGKLIDIKGDFLLTGGVISGSPTKAKAFAVFDPENLLEVKTGGSVVITGGSVPTGSTINPDLIATASIQNAGPILFSIGASGTYTHPNSEIGTIPAGLILVGGKGSGRFDEFDSPVTWNDYPIAYEFLNGGQYTVITSLENTADGYVKSRAPMALDESLFGYFTFAANIESISRGKRSLSDQGNYELKKAGQCK